MPAQIDIDHVPSSLFQPDRYIFPHLSGLPESMKEDYRRIISTAYVIRFKSDSGKALEFAYIPQGHEARSIEITAIVIREMHTSLPASSSIRTDQICVVRPIDSDVAMAKT